MKTFSNKLITEITPEIISATLAKPTRNSNFIKIKISKKIKLEESSVEKTMFYIEEFTEKQAFQKTLNSTELQKLLCENIALNFKHTYIETNDTKLTFLTNKKGKTTVLEDKINKENRICNETNCEINDSQKQNRKKQYVIQEGSPVPFLVQLGVMTEEGKIINAKYDKFKQINRFLEYIRDILPDLQQNESSRTIRIVDFGCGKSYLTFAVYHYLHEILELNVEIIGLDLKDDVITMCNLLSKKFGYEHLTFYTERIEDYFAKNSDTTVDLVITLHACDTATDYAIASAIKQNAKAILSVPCCQHELNQKVEKASNEGINAIFKYGIAKERFLALATDVMRCELLEKNGYKTQLLEFIDISHTPKNLLIRAVKKNGKSVKSSYDEIAELLGKNITLAELTENSAGI